jgi:hypothetical protein
LPGIAAICGGWPPGPGIQQGRFGRWARTDVARMAGDDELVEPVRREQLLGPDQAAVHIEIRRTDLDYVVAAGWVSAAGYATREVGRRATVDVPLYRVGALEDALLTPGVDWEAVRSAKAGEVSPLREHTRLPATRADVIRAFCTQLAAAWQVEVWPHFWNAGGQWEIDWEQLPGGHPTKDEVAAALAAHPGASRHAGSVVLSTAVGEVIRQARADLEPAADRRGVPGRVSGRSGFRGCELSAWPAAKAVRPGLPGLRPSRSLDARAGRPGRLP